MLELAAYETQNLGVVKNQYMPIFDNAIFRSENWDALTPSPEHRHIDDAVFDALGLTAGGREAVYESVSELVNNRKQRAQSVG